MGVKRKRPPAPDYHFNLFMKFAERAAQLLACAFVFFLPWQTRLILFEGNVNGGAWEYGTVALYATEIILWAAILAAGAEQLKMKSVKCKVEVKSFKFWGSVLAVGAIVLSITRSASPGLGWYWVLHAAEAVGIFWLVRRNFIRVKFLMIVLLCGAVLQSALAFWQFSGQEVFASKWLGMAFHDPAASGVSVIENEEGRFLRAYGAFPHPNILGGYLAIAIGVVLASYRKLQEVTGSYRKLLFISSFCFLVFGLVLSFSRSAWIAFLVGTAVFLIFNTAAGRRNSYFLKSFVILYVSFFIFILALWPLTKTRILGEGRLERFSIEERAGKLGEAMEIVRRHPWLGVGLGNYTLAVYNELDNARRGTAYQPVHNVFALALAEFGFLGFAALIFMEGIMTRWWSFLKRPGAFAVTVPLLILMSLDHFLWSLPFGLWLSGVMLGFASRSEDDTIAVT